MKKFLSNNNNLIISHIADIDGMGGVILAKIVFGEIDIILCEPFELDSVMHDLIDSEYDNIFITDLNIRSELVNFIDDNFHNIKHFDHHIKDYDNKFNWSISLTDIDGFKVCGTSLFYEYILNNYSNNVIINSNYVREFVENIRSYDTWDFTNTNNLDGKRLTEIFSIIGIDAFIQNYYDKIVNNYTHPHFVFDSNEINMYEKLEDDISNYIEQCDKNLIKCNFLGHKVGICISENYRSEVGHVLSSRHPELDFILIANFVRGTFSFRTNNDIDLNLIANIIGGGGHEKASGALMTNDNLKLFFDSIKEGL